MRFVKGFLFVFILFILKKKVDLLNITVLLSFQRQRSQGGENMRIKITSKNGETIGHLTTDEFLAYYGIKNMFLAEIINKFNTMKESKKEPERATLIIS